MGNWKSMLRGTRSDVAHVCAQGKPLAETLGFVIVEEGTKAIQENRGIFVEVLDPGCHFVPWCIGARVKSVLSLQCQQEMFTFGTQTKDDLYVTIVVAMQFSVDPSNVRAAFYHLPDPHAVLKTSVDTCEVNCKEITLSEIKATKGGLEQSLTTKIREAMTPAGIHIIDVMICDIFTKGTASYKVDQDEIMGNLTANDAESSSSVPKRKGFVIYHAPPQTMTIDKIA